jgi:hypothetical protein
MSRKSSHHLHRLRVTGKVVRILTKYHVIVSYWGVEVQLHVFLNLAPDGGEWSASRPSRFTPRESTWVYRTMGRPQSLSGCGGKEKKKSHPCRETNLCHPARSLVNILSYRDLLGSRVLPTEHTKDHSLIHHRFIDTVSVTVSIPYSDYNKSFDTVPCSWLLCKNIRKL